MPIREHNELEGKVFGELLVLSRAKNKNKFGILNRWICKCNCGKTIELTDSLLLSKNRISCGCLRGKLSLNPYCLIGVPKKLKSEKLEGKIFGHLKIVSKVEGYKNWNCECVCSKEIVVDEATLLAGNKKSCGCMKHKGRNPKPSLKLQAARVARGLDPYTRIRTAEEAERARFHKTISPKVLLRDNYS